MNYSQQIQRYNCEGCYKALPAGEESPCWIINDPFTINQYIFCRTCKRGNELSSLASYLNDPNFDRRKKMKIMASPEFKNWKNTQPLQLFSEEDREANRKDLERVKWGLPRIDY